MDQRPADQRYIPGDMRALATATDINRRTCQRNVPLNVIGLGLSRTAFRQALIDLGYTDCYHYSSLLNENPRDAVMWNEAMEAKFEGKGREFEKRDWDQLLGHCMAITDTPAVVFWRELIEAYPDAKCILTVRDTPEQWLESQQRSVFYWFDHFVHGTTIWERVRNWLLPPSPVSKLNQLLVKHYAIYRDRAINGTHTYIQHNEQVRATIPSDRLLVFNVKEGWKPLCDFLEIPMDQRPQFSFPRKNDSADFEKMMSDVEPIFNQIAFAAAARRFGVVLAAGASIAAWYIFNRSR